MKILPRNSKGFTLVELMIVLMIIGVIAAISTVASLSMRLNANEGLAKSSLKTIAGASETYISANGIYPENFTGFGESYLSPDLISGKKAGYTFEYKNGNSGTSYTCTAVPDVPNRTGRNSFCIDGTNLVVVYSSGTLAGDGNTCPTGGNSLST